MQIGGTLGIGATLWALSKTSFLLVVKSSSAGVYLMIVSVILLFLTGVVGIVGVLRHSQPVMGSVSIFRCNLYSFVNCIIISQVYLRFDSLSFYYLSH